jgi:anti-anti-sigma regulatory factor
MSKKAALRIDTDLTIHNAQTLFATLREQLPAKNYRLELSGVTDCDMSGMQLLLLFAREAKAAGKKFQIVGASDVIDQSLQLLQLDRYMKAKSL